MRYLYWNNIIFVNTHFPVFLFEHELHEWHEYFISPTCAAFRQISEISVRFDTYGWFLLFEHESNEWHE